jgi:hypothetical protein
MNPLSGAAMQAILALEDGRIFRGHGYGHLGECQGEVVFNTSLTGYQEIATDPSYAGQIVVLTNPQIGNYGTNLADNESAKPYIEGLIVREFSAISSNWRSEQVTDEYMERYARTGAASAHAWRDARRDFFDRDGHRRAGGAGAGDPQNGWDGSGEGGFDEVRVYVR